MNEKEKPAIFSAPITGNGRVTVPEQLRKLWKLEKGDVVELQILRVAKSE